MFFLGLITWTYFPTESSKRVSHFLEQNQNPSACQLPYHSLAYISSLVSYISESVHRVTTIFSWFQFWNPLWYFMLLYLVFLCLWDFDKGSFTMSSHFWFILYVWFNDSSLSSHRTLSILLRKFVNFGLFIHFSLVGCSLLKGRGAAIYT